LARLTQLHFIYLIKLKNKDMKRKTKRKYAHELNVGDTFVKFNNVRGTLKEFTIKEIEFSNGYEAFYIIDTNDEKWMLAYMSVMFVVK
jgi:hypothetical protein